MSKTTTKVEKILLLSKLMQLTYVFEQKNIYFSVYML